MKSCWSIVLLCLLAVVLDADNVYSSAIRDNKHDKRAINKPLSDVEHEVDDEHSPDYDHEAFLGKEEAHEFDQLSPEESRSRLGKIVEKIDSDKDGFVSEEEMVKWIKYIQKSYVTEDAKHQWEYYSKSEGDTMSWEEYKNRTYGTNVLEDGGESDNERHKEMVSRDQRRFSAADANQDGALSMMEFVDFLHPEDAEHMRDIVILETMEDIDKDGDGLISEQEYIGDMWRPTEGEEEPQWVKTEREHFSKWRDLNKDGKMDKEEVKHWIMPEDYDHAQSESKHLIHEADKDKDGRLSMKEILDSYDLFVGSQATDFGEALARSHDEF